MRKIIKPLLFCAILLSIYAPFYHKKEIKPRVTDKNFQVLVTPKIVEETQNSYVDCAPLLKIAVSETHITPYPELIETEVVSYRWEEIDTKKHHKKIYTDYREVTDRNSDQYALLQLSQTDSRTGIRVVLDDEGEWRYCVALGNYWARNQIGLYVDFHMENGSVLKCIVCDIKQDIHTINGARKYGLMANDLIEFYIDSKALKTVDYYTDGNGRIIPLKFPAGDVSNAGEEFNGGISIIVIHDKVLKGFE